MTNECESKVLLVRAEDTFLGGANQSDTHQRYKNPKVSIEAKLLGKVPPDFLRVKMLYAGLCGTDIHLLQSDRDTGFVKTSAPAKIPAQGRIMGHEGVAQILECGSNVTRFKTGDYVAFESIVACHHCDMCRRGAFNQCRESQLLGMEVDGLFGTIVDVPATIAHDVSFFANSKAGLMAAACLEPAGVAWLACEEVRIRAGDSVLIFGGGPIGVFCAMICKNVLGAARVSLVEPIERRRNLAAKWCDEVFDIESFFDQKDFSTDVVIEASGCVENIQKVFRQIHPRGRVVLLGRSGEPIKIDHVDHMITNAISITGSRGHLGGSLDRLQALYQTGRLPIEEVVTEVLDSLESLHDVLQHPERIIEEQCKVLVNFCA